MDASDLALLHEIICEGGITAAALKLGQPHRGQRGGVQLQVEALEVGLQQLTKFFIVVDEENACHGSQFSRARSDVMRGALVGADFLLTARS